MCEHKGKLLDFEKLDCNLLYCFVITSVLFIFHRENSDNGTPIVMSNFESPISQSYHNIANTLHVTLQNRAELNSINNTNSKGPNFVVE
jgi:MinD-like ATPase involved in chromosome partitioning or flagellar assembly